MSIMNVRNWKTHANAQYKSWRDYNNQYRKIIDSDKKLSNAEQRWVDMYLQPVIDFMGIYDLWRYFGNLENVDILESKSKMDDNVYSARFSGTHWTAKKPEDNKYFDPYHIYQYEGSNQFCQTYALMYLSGYLPTPTQPKSFINYYYYSLSAVQFIKFYITELKKIKELSKYKSLFNQIDKKVDVLISAPNMTLNTITLKPI